MQQLNQDIREFNDKCREKTSRYHFMDRIKFGIICGSCFGIGASGLLLNHNPNLALKSIAGFCSLYTINSINGNMYFRTQVAYDNLETKSSRLLYDSNYNSDDNYNRIKKDFDELKEVKYAIDKIAPIEIKSDIDTLSNRFFGLFIF